MLPHQLPLRAGRAQAPPVRVAARSHSVDHLKLSALPASDTAQTTKGHECSDSPLTDSRAGTVKRERAAHVSKLPRGKQLVTCYFARMLAAPALLRPGRYSERQDYGFEATLAVR